MPNITLSMDQDLYRRMKAHPDIKWTAVIRKAIEEYLSKLEFKSEFTANELRAIYSDNLKNRIDMQELEIEQKLYENAKKREQIRKDNRSEK